MGLWHLCLKYTLYCWAQLLKIHLGAEPFVSVPFKWGWWWHWIKSPPCRDPWGSELFWVDLMGGGGNQLYTCTMLVTKWLQPSVVCNNAWKCFGWSCKCWYSKQDKHKPERHDFKNIFCQNWGHKTLLSLSHGLIYWYPKCMFTLCTMYMLYIYM